jgi:Ca2+-binding RTX toxin-like protein
MTVGIWNARFTALAATSDGTTEFGLLQIAVDDGPVRVRIDWGATDPSTGDPALQGFRPPASGFFLLPAGGHLRAYADGDYTLRVTGIFDDGSRATDVLRAFFDLNNAVGIAHAGNGLDDIISGGSGNDTFDGRNGNDWLGGGFGADLLRGGQGDDYLSGGAGNDTLLGGAGEDWLFSGDGDNLMRGGDGTDFLLDGDGHSVSFGEAGSDILYGGGGGDTLSGGADADILWGDAVDDDESNDGNDLLRGGDGGDHMHGGGGNDTLDAGDGDDEFLFGESGDDLLKGGNGFHQFRGGAGNDTIVSAADGVQEWFVYDGSAFGLPDEGQDRIIGFESGIDAFVILDVDQADVGAGRFVSGLGAITDNGTWIIHDALGRLWLDTNGTDAGGLHRLAVVVGAPTLGYGDFIFPMAP